jgi:protocatechuate 3,4-dioxygenase beta subunit
MMRTALFAAGVALSTAFAALAQPADGQLSLSGTVINSATGAPVRYAAVGLLPNGITTQTDAAGAFQFSHLAAGDYVVKAAKSGFVPVEGEEEGTELSLTESRENFVVRLKPLAAIRGRVSDSSGEPVEGATVIALRSGIEFGRRRYRMASMAVTNDRGEYRIAQLLGGRYLVKASGNTSYQAYYGDRAPPPETVETFAPVYFGGSHEAAGATLLAVQAGAEGRADFAVTLQAGHSIRGRLANYRQSASATLQLSSGDEDLGLTASSLELATGRFEIRGVPDGAYRLRAYQLGDDDRLQFAEQPIAVAGRDLGDVILSLAPAPTLKGTARVEGAEDGTAPYLYAYLQPQDALLASSRNYANWRSSPVKDGIFEIPSVLPGKYWITFQPGVGQYAASAQTKSSDLLATQELVVNAGAAPEIEVVLRTDGGSVAGSIAPAAVGSEELVALLAPESCKRPVQVADVDQGGFVFPGVAPGSYRLYAWKRSAPVECGTQESVCALAHGGVRVEVEAGRETKVQLQSLSEEPK